MEPLRAEDEIAETGREARPTGTDRPALNEAGQEKEGKVGKHKRRFWSGYSATGEKMWPDVPAVGKVRQPLLIGVQASGKRRPVIGSVGGSFPLSCRNAVSLAGADLLVIPTNISGKEIGRLFGRMCDGLLLMGGGDIEPTQYGQANMASRGINTRRDKVERGLLEMARLSHRPILGICRGHQMMVVASGGSLYQHIGGHHMASVHDVSLVGSTRLRSVLAELVVGGEVVVNSYHHQAVQMMPSGFRVAGHYGRTIEAIEHESEPWIGVQWHPELLAADDPDWLCLFEWLVRQARKWRKEYRKK